MPSPLFFLCDIQTKFAPVIYAYDHVVATANKMVRLAKILDCELVVTTQHTRGLGPTDPAIELDTLGPLLLGNFDKTRFSMLVPQVKEILDARPSIDSIILFGIESHVCVLQTVLDILSLTKCTPYVLADGVSSSNSFEIPIALDRMRAAGAVVTTSESIAFQLLGDASSPAFKSFSKLVKEEKESTRRAGEALILSRGHEMMGINNPLKSAM